MARRRNRRKKHAVAKLPVSKPQLPTCPLCGEPAHQGDSEESLAALAALNEEAAVYYDRDLATNDDVEGLCGPRFRKNSSGLYAHYGSAGGCRYVVYTWLTGEKRWNRVLDNAGIKR